MVIYRPTRFLVWIKPYGTMNPDNDRFQLQPERQELDLKGFGDPLVLSWIYAGTAWSTFLGYFWYTGAGSWTGPVTILFYFFTIMTGLLIGLQLLGIAIAFIGKKAARRRINKSSMSLEIDRDTLAFNREEEPVFTIPLDAIDRIEERVDKNNLMLGPRTGYNFVTESYDRKAEEDAPSTNVEVVDEQGTERYHFWLDSRAIGTTEQIDRFHSWLSEQNLDRYFETTSREKHYNWTASDWFWVIVHTIVLLGTLLYAFILR